MTRVPNEHLSAERLQALLEGELPEAEATLAEEHLAGCARCSSELDAWKILLEDLDGLPSLGPDDGFARRVMAAVTVEPVAHVGLEMLQEHLDGALAPAENARLVAHLAACAPCSDEAARWTALVTRLDALDRLDPGPEFAPNVMRRWSAGREAPVAVSGWSRMAAFVMGEDSLHPAQVDLATYADGALNWFRQGRVRRHVDACTACQADVGRWQELIARLDALERFSPSRDLAAPVLGAVALPQGSTAVVRTRFWQPVVHAASSGASNLLAAARRLVPRSRRAWAAISGVAVTPASIVALIGYTVFSHPTLTLGSLASFVWWKVSDLATAAWGWTSASIMQSGELFGAYTLLETLASAPFAVAGGALAYALSSFLALRVPYRYLVSNRPMEGRYVRVSAT